MVERVRFPLLKDRKKERRRKVRVRKRKGKGRSRRWPRIIPII